MGVSNIYAYYGDQALASGSNGDNTFIIFDDFNGTSLDSSKWINRKTGSTTLTVSDGYVRQYSASGNANNQHIWSSDYFDNNVSIDMRYRLGPSLYRATFAAATGYSTTHYYITSGQYTYSHLVNAYSGVSTLYTSSGGSKAFSPENHTSDTWTRIAMIHGSSYQKAYINESLRATINTSMTQNTYHLLIGEVSPYNNSFYIDTDWVFVRKYNEGPPSIYIGNEESR
ncbi:MAG: hypothetical protein BWY21_01494 [Parcubacteria group bacterium ADurb.Bin216]|nr:MAG: hypothetical protein BWY21_01494 [Parcubacteria group bacterium ADurb.Bin216]